MFFVIVLENSFPLTTKVVHFKKKHDEFILSLKIIDFIAMTNESKKTFMIKNIILKEFSKFEKKMLYWLLTNFNR